MRVQSQFIEMFGNSIHTKKLIEVCNIEKGTTITKEQTSNGDIPVVAGGLEPSYYHNVANRPAGMITVSASGANAGYVNYWEVPIFASDCNTIYPIESEKVNPIFMYWQLKVIQKQIYKLQKGGAQPHVYGKDLADMQIVQPPMEFQLRYVKIAEQADKSKFVGFKSQFIEMFGDPITNTKGWTEYGYIGNYAQIVLGSTPNSKNPLFWGGDIKWITPAEMSEESYYIYDTERHLTEEGLKSANLTLLPYKTVLFSTRAPIGKVGLAGSPMYCNQGFKNFICGNKLNPTYLYYSLIYKRDYLVSLGTGTTFKELSRKAVENLKIAVPPIERQDQFETIYKQADKSKYYN